MALRIIRQPQQSALEREIAGLWRMVAADPIMREYFYRDHPFFAYELHDCSDAMNYTVSFKNDLLPDSVTGSAFCHDFHGVYTPKDTESRFIISFSNVIRNLICNKVHKEEAERRAEIWFYDSEGVCNWDKVNEYINLMTHRLHFLNSEHLDSKDFYSVVFTSDVIDTAVFGFHLPKKLSQIHTTDETLKQNPNHIMKGHIMNALVRSLIAARNNKDAEMNMKAKNLGPEISKVMLDLKHGTETGMIAPLTDQANLADQLRERMEAERSNQKAVL